MYIYIFFILVGTFCFVTSFVMSIWFKTNRILNICLIITFSSSSLYLILHGMYHMNFFLRVNYDQYHAILVVMPTFFLYFNKLILNNKFFEKQDYLYYIGPILLYIFFGDYIFSVNIKHRIILFVFMFLYTVYFIFKSYMLLRINIWSRDKKQNYNYDFKIINDWTIFLFIVVIVNLLIVFASKLINLLNENFDCNPILETLLLLLYSVVYFKIVFTPILLYGSPCLLKRLKSEAISKVHINKVWKLEINKEGFSAKDTFVSEKIQDEILTHIKQIEKIAFRDNSFREPGYSLSDLSIGLGLPKYYIEFIFKYHCKVSFNDYRNLVRIYDAIKLINEGYLKSNKLDTLARYIGFASYNPFLVNFKGIVGVSPFDFNNNRKMGKINLIFEEI
jgi:AraC-like DNA-binding protein